MSNLLKKKAVLKVQKYLKRFDEAIKIILLDETARTAKDAARSLDKDVGAIVKSLLFKSSESDDFYLCLISGDKLCNTNKIEILVNKKIIKANADECKKFTGFSIGGVAPVAHINSPMSILIDKNLSNYEEIFAAAGHPHVVFGISFIALCEITKGIEYDITN